MSWLVDLSASSIVRDQTDMYKTATWVLTASVVSYVADTLPQEYFPPGTFSQDLQDDRAAAELVSRHLETLGEPRLYSAHESSETYRFLWLPAFEPGLMVKVMAPELYATLKVGILPSGPGGGEPVVGESRLEERQWQRIRQEIEEATFWTELPNRPRPSGTLVMDASYWIIEGVRGGSYKIIHRAPPDLDRDRDFIDIGLSLLELAGFDLEELGLLPRRQRKREPPTRPAKGAKVHASILEVIFKCHESHGRQVTVLGAVDLEFENQALCPTKEFLAADSLNCLWLETDDPWNHKQLEITSKRVRRGDYLIMNGTVSCERRGHWGLYGATLRKITSIIHDSRSEVLWDSSAVDPDD